ncbi:MAG TPA: NUDIX hydrolase [Polyangia bacterium]|nr:NUDIX hydrolase [Polyangia bacterium]
MAVVVEKWTGQRACLLQAALRHTNESFAHHLGIAVRTVAAWHADPALTPRAEIQQILDTALERAPQAAVERFTALLSQREADGAQALTVAVAVVRRGDSVLLACRRGGERAGLRWQFPAGVVKPGADPAAVAVAETLAETGVHAAVTADLGRRVHPLTGVVCEYLLCDYLTGDAHNADTLENLDVAWAPVATLARFIPLDAVFPPVLDALEFTRDAADD